MLHGLAPQGVLLRGLAPQGSVTCVSCAAWPDVLGQCYLCLLCCVAWHLRAVLPVSLALRGLAPQGGVETG